MFQKFLDKAKIYQQEMGHTYTEIQLYREEDTTIFISHFRILSSFFARYFRCILIFNIWVISDILFIENRRVQTRFRARPHVFQVSPMTSRFWQILPKRYQIQKEQAYKETPNQEEKVREITIREIILIGVHYCSKC